MTIIKIHTELKALLQQTSSMSTIGPGLPSQSGNISFLSLSLTEKQMQQASTCHHVAAKGVLPPNHKQKHQHIFWLEHQGCIELVWLVMPALL